MWRAADKDKWHTPSVTLNPNAFPCASSWDRIDGDGRSFSFSSFKFLDLSMRRRTRSKGDDVGRKDALII